MNTYAFFALYANIDGFTHADPPLPLAERQEIDRWIISELHSLVRRYHEYMQAYDVTKAARSISDFTIDQLSNWYVRRNRRRFWKGETGRDKTAAYQTLYECLVTVAKLMAPVAPFLAEEIYRNLNTVTRRETSESVHLALSPVADPAAIDVDLERRMERAEKIVMLVRAMRMKSNLKVRQPLPRIILPIASDAERAEVRRVEEVILDEVNVKAIEYVTDESGIVSRRAKPNFKALGPKFGKGVQQVAARVREMSHHDISLLESGGQVTVEAGGGAVTIERTDVEIVREDIAGWLVASEGGLTVALDTTLSDELVAEGLAREFVNRVQNMRKDAGFEVTDRIAIWFTGPGDLCSRLRTMGDYIRKETLAVELIEGERRGEYTSTAEIDGGTVHVAIERRPVGT